MPTTGKLLIGNFTTLIDIQRWTQVPAAVDASRQLFYGLPFTATSDGGVYLSVVIWKQCTLRALLN